VTWAQGYHLAKPGPATAWANVMERDV
jgi:hypothetical protein